MRATSCCAGPGPHALLDKASRDASLCAAAALPARCPGVAVASRFRTPGRVLRPASSCHFGPAPSQQSLSFPPSRPHRSAPKWVHVGHYATAGEQAQRIEQFTQTELHYPDCKDNNEACQGWASSGAAGPRVWAVWGEPGKEQEGRVSLLGQGLQPASAGQRTALLQPPTPRCLLAGARRSRSCQPLSSSRALQSSGVCPCSPGCRRVRQEPLLHGGHQGSPRAVHQGLQQVGCRAGLPRAANTAVSGAMVWGLLPCRVGEHACVTAPALPALPLAPQVCVHLPACWHCAGAPTFSSSRPPLGDARLGRRVATLQATGDWQLRTLHAWHMCHSARAR